MKWKKQMKLPCWKETASSGSRPRKVVDQQLCAPSPREALRLSQRPSDLRCINWQQCLQPTWVHFHWELLNSAKARPAQSTPENLGRPVAETLSPRPSQTVPWCRDPAEDLWWSSGPKTEIPAPWEVKRPKEKILAPRHYPGNSPAQPSSPRPLHWIAIQLYVVSMPMPGHWPSIHVKQQPAEQHQWISTASGHAGG